MSARRAILAGLALGVALAARVAAQTCVPPPNEDCDDAVPFDAGDLPLHVVGVYGCTNDVVDRPYLDIFYRYDCTVTGTYYAGMCGSVADAYIKIWTDACGALSGGTLVAEDDDDCGGSPPSADPELTVTLTAGVTYWFELGTWRPDPPWAPDEPNARFFLDVELLPPACPADCVAPPDGVVDISDLLEVLARWSTVGPCDVDGSGVVDVGDLLDVLGDWGPCPATP